LLSLLFLSCLLQEQESRTTSKNNKNKNNKNKNEHKEQQESRTTRTLIRSAALLDSVLLHRGCGSCCSCSCCCLFAGDQAVPGGHHDSDQAAEGCAALCTYKSKN
jgi:hypothetical protein